MKLHTSKTGAITGTTMFVDLPKVTRPAFTDDLKFPNDITELTSQNVSELIGKYTALLGYALHQASQLSVKLIATDREINSLESEIFKDNPKINHIERWKRDAIIASDEQMLILHARRANVRQLKEVAEGYVRIYEAYISALSRELTRKMSTSDGMRFNNAR